MPAIQFLHRRDIFVLSGFNRLLCVVEYQAPGTELNGASNIFDDLQCTAFLNCCNLCEHFESRRLSGIFPPFGQDFSGERTYFRNDQKSNVVISSCNLHRANTCLFGTRNIIYIFYNVYCEHKTLCSIYCALHALYICSQHMSRIISYGLYNTTPSSTFRISNALITEESAYCRVFLDRAHVF